MISPSGQGIFFPLLATQMAVQDLGKEAREAVSSAQQAGIGQQSSWTSLLGGDNFICIHTLERKEADGLE